MNKGNLPRAFGKEDIVQQLQLLTVKKQLYLLDGEKKDVPPELLKKIGECGAYYLIENLADAPDINMLVKKAYEILGLISFFTTGEDETRAWTVYKGTAAPEAAGVIHTDFEKKFIRAEIVTYEKLIEAGGWNQAKQRGWMRLEGKEYRIQDGDVLVVRHA